MKLSLLSLGRLVYASNGHVKDNCSFYNKNSKTYSYLLLPCIENFHILYTYMFSFLFNVCSKFIHQFPVPSQQPGTRCATQVGVVRSVTRHGTHSIASMHAWLGFNQQQQPAQHQQHAMDLSSRRLAQYNYSTVAIILINDGNNNTNK